MKRVNDKSTTGGGTGKTVKTVSKTAATAKAVQTPTKAQPLTGAALVKDRLSKRTKLETLYKDIDQLEQALQEFNRISGYGDVRVQINCAGHSFTTTRQDTVDASMKAIRESIEYKLERAHAELAGFEF